jgi:hypothetical protein
VLFYSFAGLVLASEIPLPGLTPLRRPAETSATIRLGDTPDRLFDAIRLGPNWAISETQLLLAVPGLACFLLRDGCDIEVRLASERQIEDAGPFLTQNLLGLLIQQRGVVLRASAVAIAGRALLFLGDSTAGKSTLAAAMAKRGHRFLGDDCCAIASGSDGAVIVHADGGASMLWADAIETFKLGPEAGETVRKGIEKYPVQLADGEVDGLPVAGIYSLGEDRRLEGPHIENLRGMKAVRVVRDSAYRPRALATAEQRLRHFQAAAAIARRTPVFSLGRPSGFDWIDEGVKAIETRCAAAT